jgi:hypothetical protein
MTCILCPNERDSDLAICSECKAKFKLNPGFAKRERKLDPTPDIRGGGNPNGNGAEQVTAAELPKAVFDGFVRMYKERAAG